MNAQRLLAHYERIADAPDAVGRLRRLILDLAVRGKLVPQDPRDEPAAELLKRIAVEKARLVKAGEIRKEKPLPEIEPDKAPFPIPHRWQWGRVRQVTSDRGQMVPNQSFTYIDVTAINKEAGRIEGAKAISAAEAPSRARKIVRKGDVLYSCVRPYLLNIAIVEGEFSPPAIASTAFAVLNSFSLVVPRYQWIVLRSPFFVVCVDEKMRGQAYPAINDSDFSLLPFPLPPLAEQHRIVAKVDELMALCDRLEAARTDREKRRDRLTSAALTRLNEPDEGTFQADARIVLKALPALTTRADQIKRIRQTILNLAVRGKLVPQDPRDEPAASLVNRIMSAKAQMRINGERRKEASLEEVDEGEVPYMLPKGWSWARLGKLGETNIGLTYSPGDVAAVGTPVLRSNNIKLGKLDIEDLVRVRCDPKPSVLVREEDLLICARNGSRALVGKVARIESLKEPTAFGAFMAIFRSELNRYLYLFISSPVFRQVIDEVNTTTINQITQNNLRSTLVPVPPRAEQDRIVAKVDKLKALSITSIAHRAGAVAARRRLLDALLTEALAPAA